MFFGSFFALLAYLLKIRSRNLLRLRVLEQLEFSLIFL